MPVISNGKNWLFPCSKQNPCRYPCKSPAVNGGMEKAPAGLEASCGTSPPSERVRAVCAEVDTADGEVVEAVNFNDPLQTVVAGTKDAVERACAALKAAGARRALPLPVSAPFHSSLMQPAAEKLKAALAEVTLAAPQIPVVNNVDVAVETEPERIRDALYRQAFHPVRWVECIQKIRTMGAQAIIECGPGKALLGMTRRIDPQAGAAAIFDPATLAEAQPLTA